MSLDKETVREIAFLSRLDVSSNIDEVHKDMQDVFNLLEQLNEADVEDVEPMVSINGGALICRQDIVVDGGNSVEVLANAPAQEFGYFVVPKVVE